MLFFQLVQTTILTASMTLAAPLSVEEVVKKTLSYSQEIKRAKSEVSDFEYQSKQTLGGIFPKVNAIGNYDTHKNSRALSNNTNTTNSAVGETFLAGLELSQPLYVGGAFSNGYDLAKTREEISRVNVQSVRQNTILAAIAAFYEYSKSTQKLNAAVENRDILKSYLDITRRYEKIGRIKTTDRLQANVNFAQSLADVEQVRNSLAAAKASIERQINERIDESTTILPVNTKIKIESITLDKALATAVKNNPQLRINQLQVESVEYDKGIALASDLPNLFLVGGAGYTAADRPSLFEERAQYYKVGLNLTIPIFSGLSSISKRKSYNEKYYQAQRDQELGQNILREQLTLHLAQLKTYEEQLKYAESASKESKSALVIANKGYERGTVPSTDVVSLQRTRYETEKILIDAQYSYLLTLAQLRVDMGIDLEKIYAP